MTSEFELIDFIAEQTGAADDVLLGIGDDAAILQVPADNNLVVTTDTMVAGTHFLPQAEPFALGHKLLAVNLSDLAAMGATPRWVSLALTLPAVDSAWLSAFLEGFFSLARRFDVTLIGGDTTRGPMSFTVTAQGIVPTGKAIQRSGAKPGDILCLSRPIGAAGLAFTHQVSTCAEALHQPEPEVTLGQSLRDYATSAIDISDGFLADCNHLLQRSQVGAQIKLEQIPIAKEYFDHFNREQAYKHAITAGDDYALCFTISPLKLTKLQAPAVPIGTITHTKELLLTLDTKTQNHPPKGFQHFP